jgi:hypothetical protein
MDSPGGALDSTTNLTPRRGCTFFLDADPGLTPAAKFYRPSGAFFIADEPGIMES